MNPSPAALILKPPTKPAPPLTPQQSAALNAAKSPDLISSLSDSQKIQMLLDINTVQQDKLDHLDATFTEFRHWVQTRFFIVASGGVLGGAGIGYGGAKALTFTGALLGWF